MRTAEERVAAAKRRARELVRQKRRCRAAAFAGAAACLALILGLALAMPAITEHFSDAAYSGGMTASVFSGGSLGCIVVGVLAFALGVCVTLLCVRLRNYERDWDREDKDDA